MKKLLILSLLFLTMWGTTNAQEQKLAPYIKIGQFNEDISALSSTIEQALKTANFDILGTYNPENNPNLKIIAFTRTDLINTVSKVDDRGALAAILKVGFVTEGEKVTVSYVNPNYIFNAYLRKEMPKYATALNAISNDVKNALADRKSVV